MTPKDHEVAVKCPLETCPFYSEDQNWHKWRGKVEVQVENLEKDMATIKRIGMAVVGAILLQLLVSVWTNLLLR
jgi:hypothetical protein